MMRTVLYPDPHRVGVAPSLRVLPMPKMTGLWAKSVVALLWLAHVAVAQPGNPPNRGGGLNNRAVEQLKTALQQNLSGGSESTTDSLRLVARALGYAPGEVVGLCQMAVIRFQQQQPQLAGDLIDEAQKLAPTIAYIDEAGWAMRQLGLLRKRNGQQSQAFAPVLTSLGLAMTNGIPSRDFEKAMQARKVDKGRRERDSLDGQQNRKSWQREINGLTEIPRVQVPEFDKKRYPSEEDITKQVRAGFTDRWLDGLVDGSHVKAPVIEQLTATRKIRDSSKQLSKAFADKGDYAQAYKYFLRYTAYKDSLTTEVTARQVALLEAKRVNQQKEAQIRLLTKDRQLREQETQRQRQFVAVLAGLTALLLAVLFVLIRTNRQKQRTNSELNEQRLTLQTTLEKLKATQSQLIQSEKMASLGELTAGIAHEIQNPLNFVNNFSEVSAELVAELTDEAVKPQRDTALETELLADLSQNLQKITHHGNRAASIVRNMLQHSRSGSGDRQPVDINALVEEYLNLAYHAMRAKDKTFEARLTRHLEPGLGVLTVVPEEMGRVLLNLFNNALYAVQQRSKTGEETYVPEVLVSTRRVGDQLVVRVRDNGTGMPEEVRAKVFQPFFTTKPTGSGTGLGLSLSYDIITKGYGGTLSVKSKEDLFTEFTISLPVG